MSYQCRCTFCGRLFISENKRDVTCPSCRMIPILDRNRFEPLNDLAEAINEWCHRKGWNEDLVLGNMIANLHTEISEAWELIRNGHDPKEVWYENHVESPLPKPEGFGIELIDLIIRALHICSYYGIDADKLMAEKMEYNETRSYRHGNKKA